MSEILKIVMLTAAAGSCIPLGGALASIERFRPRWLESEFRHFLIAFGGGILLGAVSFVLIPEGIEGMHDSLLVIPFVLAGGIAFFFFEWRLGLKRRETPQLMGTLLDYVPEAIALGGLVTLDADVAVLLAVLIGLQNLPEGFNAYRELMALNGDSKKTLASMCALVLLGPIAGLSGYFVLAQHPVELSAIMLFASGGILYLIFQDIAPQARMRKHWAPPLGAVFGFCLALFSKMLVEHA
jgi:ZIP family zinc transporter